MRDVPRERETRGSHVTRAEIRTLAAALESIEVSLLRALARAELDADHKRAFIAAWSILARHARLKRERRKPR